MNKLKIVTILGVRPQFIKAAAVSRAIQENFKDHIQEVIVHTGQHFDPNMSDSFFEQLNIPKPDYNLEISGGTHGDMTGKMLSSIEKILIDEKPDWVLVYGDTNSTLAGALAASKLHIPIAHVEAGLRSFNKEMPEEINRILTDHLSTLLFCPTETAISNLKNEGIEKGVHNVGDVMYDVSLFYQKSKHSNSATCKHLNIETNGYALATCHRQENTDSLERLKNIVMALAEISQSMPVVFPLHPRTKKIIQEQNLISYLNNVIITEPLSFLEMMDLEQNARVIITDSGGVQKEAFFCNVPCVTMRDETEWTETISLGCNHLVGAVKDDIVKASLNAKMPIEKKENPYGSGNSSDSLLRKIIELRGC